MNFSIKQWPLNLRVDFGIHRPFLSKILRQNWLTWNIHHWNSKINQTSSINIFIYALIFAFSISNSFRIKNQYYAWEKPSGDIVVQNQIIYMHQQNMHTMHYCYPTIIWICLLANKFQEKLHLIVIERGELSSWE